MALYQILRMYSNVVLILSITGGSFSVRRRQLESTIAPVFVVFSFNRLHSYQFATPSSKLLVLVIACVGC